MSMSEGAAAGRLEGLKALRDILAAAIDCCDSARDLAALSRQMTDVLSAIAVADPPKVKGNPLDELASRRAGRSAS